MRRATAFRGERRRPLMIVQHPAAGAGRGVISICAEVFWYSPMLCTAQRLRISH